MTNRTESSAFSDAGPERDKTPEEAGPFGPARNRRRWTIIALLSLGMTIAYVDRSNLSVALAVDDFKRFFALSDTDRGTLNSAFFWSYALLQIPAGWVVDRYGVRFPYALGFFFWSLVSASTALARSVPQLLFLRVFLGVGEAIVAPASYCWIRHNFSERERGLAVGLYMTGTKIGPAIGAPVAAWLIVSYDWRMMFLILGLGGLLWLVPWLALVRKEDVPGPQPVQAGTTPVSFGRLLGSPVIIGTVIATFCYMYFVYFCMTWMPAYFVERRGMSLSSMGLYTFFSFGGMATVAALAGWAADLIIRRGYNPINVRKGFTICGFLVACTELLGAQADSLAVALFFAVFSLSGLGLATANYWALTQTLVPGSAIGRISGVQNCAASVAGIVAPLLTGWLKQQTGSYEAPMQAIWLFLLAGVASYLFLVRQKYAPSFREDQSPN
ncbi:MAG: MFS transporter [Acidobacteria bacterium]|nr:MAG: MFS transporter [Acidobacteriota bacterium]